MEAGPGTAPVTDHAAADAVVVVPVKSFHAAKARLGGDLSAEARARLARVMAERVLAAAAPLRVAVVCDDADVAEWAGDRGARVLWVPGPGLDHCVGEAVRILATDGVSRAVVAHGDLPLARALAGLGGEPAGITLVPDRHDDGTNVIVVPTGAGFRFSYGPGSFQRHQDEAARLGLPVHVARSRWLGTDVDDAADLAEAVSADPTLLAALEPVAAPVAGR